MTLGLIAGSILAEARYGTRYFADPKILLSGLMWVVYMVSVLHALECGMAGSAGCISGDVCVWRGCAGLGGQ